ncbi:MAG: adenylate/guanylate cyclase domain-containing protein [Elusimicrobiales bacterium]|nr:adenylate/guanylate cyclase domain-containing protein [Elusimicrobiales bacterium]
MFSDKQKAERKKEMNEFFALMGVPFILSVIGSVFYRFAFAALTGAAAARPGGVRAGGGAGDMFLGTDFGFSMGIMAALVYLWGRPAHLYIRNPSPELKDKIRRRLAGVYQHGFAMLFIAQGLALAVSSAAPGRLSGAHFASAAFAFLAQAAMLVVYIDAQLSKQKTLMANLYPGEEIFSLRPGFSIPIYLKITTLISGFALIPFLLIYLAFFNRVPWDSMSGDFVAMLFVSGAILLHGIGSVYNGIQKPLDGLVGRMRRVAEGDYSRTRIYFSDEVAYLKAGYNEMVAGLREREELHDTFGKYLSIEIARELIKNKKVNLGGEAIEAAVMFCDIRNFTPLSEKLSATEMVSFLNDYFHYVTPPITAHNGVISKFMGDAVMAIYAPLLGSNDYASDAVSSAAEMRAALEKFNASGKAPGRVEFGVGIHCGRLVAGNIGTAARLEYTFIGDTVNAASRIESRTKDLGTDILVSPQVLAALGPDRAGFRFESVGAIALKGKAEPMELHKLL